MTNMPKRQTSARRMRIWLAAVATLAQNVRSAPQALHPAFMSPGSPAIPPNDPCGTYANPFIQRNFYQYSPGHFFDPSEHQLPSFDTTGWDPCDQSVYMGYAPPQPLPAPWPPVDVGGGNNLQPIGPWPPAYPDCCQLDYTCMPECNGGGNLPPQEHLGCPISLPGWTNVSPGYDVYLGEVAEVTWYEAEAKAKEKRAELAKVDRQTEAALLSLVQRCYPAGTGLWIGANDLAHAGDLVWADGEPVQNPPPFMSQVTNGRCLELNSWNGAWRRAACPSRDPRGFIATRATPEERPQSTATPPSAATTPSPSPSPTPSSPVRTTPNVGTAPPPV